MQSDSTTDQSKSTPKNILILHACNATNAHTTYNILIFHKTYFTTCTYKTLSSQETTHLPPLLPQHLQVTLSQRFKILTCKQSKRNFYPNCISLWFFVSRPIALISLFHLWDAIKQWYEFETGFGF
ncbi:hypothetical protein An04g03410 [Aspergillus niger]|uniref:Uncharacterized protein n=2 Tax=Aspergillus niger TaxID=5061 RepID=A2QIG2_ASPNC|nr:hypothetical protein An04g03410 [Aspergillus niger]CAK38606.1 hypothetical protein An04g03410 [Aspergillus niger]